MPSTPVSWRPQQVVSSSDGFADNENDQYDPRIIHLASGNILVTYTTNSDEDDADPSGRDIMGRLYDPLGNAIDDEWRVNDVAHNNEQDMEIAALSSGGFISVYEEQQIVGGLTSIHVRVYSETGSGGSSITVVEDTDNALPSYYNPNVAAVSGSFAFITYEVVNGLGDVDIAGRYFNPATGFVFAENIIFDGASGVGEGIEGHSVAGLNNGTYVVAWADQDGGATDNDDVQFSIVNVFTGASSPTTIYNGSTDSGDPHVTALTGGGFVVTWVVGVPTSGNQGVRGRIYDSAGANPSAVFNPATTNTGAQLAPVAAQLQDGGFVIVWFDAPTQDINGQRYDASGTKVGDEFTLDTSAIGDPIDIDIDIEGLADGRFAITWNESHPGGSVPGGGTGNDTDIRMAIWDPRNGANTPDYAPDSWQIGTVGEDTITANGDTVHGWNGNDEITEGTADEIFGGHGDDRITIFGISSQEHVDGGSGRDTLVIGTPVEGATYLLWDDIASTPGGDHQTIADFENFVGSSADETVAGTDGENSISLGGGSDTVNGLGGNDWINLSGNLAGDLDDIDGGSGVDTAYFGNTAAIWVDLAYTGATGIEAWTRDNTTVTSGAWRGLAHLEDVENVFGTIHDDVFFGDDQHNRFVSNRGSDIMFGRGGQDTFSLRSGFDDIDGGTGHDTVDFYDYLGAVWVDLAYTGATGFEAWTTGGNTIDPVGGAWQAIGNFESIESIIGSFGSDVLYGNDEGNQFSGRFGNDQIFLRGGGDTYIYTDGFDTVDGGAGEDVVDFSPMGSALWVDLSYSGATGFEAWTTGGETIDPIAGTWQAVADLTSIENVVGTDFDDVFRDDLGNNSFHGGNGADVFYLSGGLDWVRGGLFNQGDRVNFSEYATAVWVDLAYTGATGYEAWTRGGSDVASGAWQAIGNFFDIEHLTGSSFDDRLRGDAGHNELGGDGGDDELVFTEGFDAYVGGSGSDTVDFSEAGFAVFVALDYGTTDREAWTRDGTDLDSGTWRPIGDLHSVENVVGTDFEDYLRGDTADNRITGGGSADTFAFGDNFGSDTITDFQDAAGPQDRMDFFLNGNVNDMGDITSITVVGGDTIVTTVDGIVTLEGITGGIGAADFIF